MVSLRVFFRNNQMGLYIYIYVCVYYLHDTKIEDIHRFFQIEVAKLGVARSHLK